MSDIIMSNLHTMILILIIYTCHVGTTMASSLDHSLSDSSSANNSTAVASGISGAFLLMLLIALLIVVLIIGIGILKRRKSTKVQSGSARYKHQIQVIIVYTFIHMLAYSFEYL